MAQKTKVTDVVVTVDNEAALAMLNESYPVEKGFASINLPRLSMASQDKTEGKGKSMKVVVAAGTFFTEKQTEEEDENGKKIWEKTEIGDTIEGVILYQRKQLRMYDEATEQFTSSFVYDSDDEVISLFCDKAKVGEGTPKELKAKYEYVDKNTGKVKSKLEDNRILYVLYEGTVYQLNLRGSSMYAFLTYARKTLPPSVLTKFSSEAKEKGSIEWNQMTFEAVRKLNNKELNEVVGHVAEIKEIVNSGKKTFAKAKDSEDDADKDMKGLVAESGKVGKHF